MKTLVYKELRAVFLSPKFPATFGICSVMILLSVLIGISEYRANLKANSAGQQLVNQYWHDATEWQSVGNTIFRQTDPMQIFVSGVSYDIGRSADVDRYKAPSLVGRSVYTGDLIFAVFRFLDFSFIVLIVLSLLAIVFSYDAISGEREAGTLRLVFSHQVSRARYLMAKCLGTWLGLVVPLGVPILICILLVQVLGVDMSGLDWLRLVLLLGLALVFVSFFIVLGVLVSALTRRPSASFLISLMCWLLLVFVIPRVGVIAANSAVEVPTGGSILSQKTKYWTDQWGELMKGMNARFDGYTRKWDASDPSFQQKWRAAEDSLQVEIISRIWKFESDLQTGQRNAEAVQQRWAVWLGSLSPAFVFQNAAMKLANTDVDLKRRYEESLSEYSRAFRSYLEHKRSTSPPSKADETVMIQLGKGRTMGINGPRPKQLLDLSDVPIFEYPAWPAQGALTEAAIDMGLLLCFIFAAFAGAWVAFMRYDLR